MSSFWKYLYSFIYRLYYKRQSNKISHHRWIKWAATAKKREVKSYKEKNKKYRIFSEVFYIIIEGLI
jgi:hypothetical protein